MAKIRGVRFSEKEEIQIDEFLNKNPIFDFSTLAKTAILQFMLNPEVILKPISKEIVPKKKGEHVRTN